MKQLMALTLVFLALTTIAGQAETYSLENGAITFEAPAGFKPLSKNVMAIKYPRGRPPRFAVGNTRATVSIAYDLKPHSVPQDKIDEARAAFSKLFPRMIPGIVWKQNRTIQLAGQKWGLLEMTSAAIDTDIHNVMLFTGYKGRMLIFNFNSTKNEFKAHEAALRKSILSIRIVR